MKVADHEVADGWGGIEYADAYLCDRCYKKTYKNCPFKAFEGEEDVFCCPAKKCGQKDSIICMFLFQFLQFLNYATFLCM